MQLAFVGHDHVTGQVKVYQPPGVATITPKSTKIHDRVWSEEVTVELSNGKVFHDTDPGRAIMEVLGCTRKTAVLLGG